MGPRLHQAVITTHTLQTMESQVQSLTGIKLLQLSALYAQKYSIVRQPMEEQCSLSVRSDARSSMTTRCTLFSRPFILFDHGSCCGISLTQLVFFQCLPPWKLAHVSTGNVPTLVVLLQGYQHVATTSSLPTSKTDIRANNMAMYTAKSVIQTAATVGANQTVWQTRCLEHNQLTDTLKHRGLCKKISPNTTHTVHRCCRDVTRK